MRQLFVQTPPDSGERVLALADDLSPINTALFEAHDRSGTMDLVMLHLSNRSVEPFLERLQDSDLRGVQVSFFPRSILALRPSVAEAADQATDIEMRSPVEVYLAGYQSIGSWTSFLGYAVAAGVIVWVGLFTGTVYLLTAAMLVAPFAGPAMNAALATASDDARLLRRSIVRYASALALTIGITFVLSLLLLDTPTSMMVTQSKVASVSLLLPLTAGVAGALFLSTSDGSSLVSGAAVGVLVAASLAPPAGIVGMAAALGRWDLVYSSGFVLVLQLVGINLSGALVLRALGLNQRGMPYGSRTSHLFLVSMGTTVVLLAGLLYLQLANPVSLERGSLEQRISATAEEVVNETGFAEAVAVNTQFLRPSSTASTSDASSRLLIEIYARPGVSTSQDVLSEQLLTQLQDRLQLQWPSIQFLVHVSLVRGLPRGEPS